MDVFTKPSRDALVAAVGDVADESMWSTVDGDDLLAFEEHAATLFGTKYAVATNNGTNALLAAAAALRLRAGTRILVPAYGFYGMIAPFRFMGLEIVFVDVSCDSWCATVRDYQRALTSDPAAILVFHPWGNVGPAREIAEWAAAHDLPVIVDASHAHGAAYDQKPIGAYATLTAASFGRGKLISGGELGVCATDSSEARTFLLALGHPNRPRQRLPHEGLDVVPDYAFGPKLRPHRLALRLALAQFEPFRAGVAAMDAAASEMERIARETTVFRPIARFAKAARRYWRVVFESTVDITEPCVDILKQRGFVPDTVGYRCLLSDHPICTVPGPRVHRQFLSAEFVARARALMSRLVYFTPPQGTDWQSRWRSALDELQRAKE